MTVISYSVPGKLVAVGNYTLYVFNTGGAGTAVGYYAINMTTLIAGNEVDLVSTSGSYYDATTINGTAYITYGTAAGGVGIIEVNSSLSFVTSVSVASQAATSAITVFGDTANNVCVAYSSGSNIKVLAYNAALGSQVLAPTTIDSGVTYVTALTGVASGVLTADVFATSNQLLSPPAGYFPQIRHASFVSTSPGSPAYTQQTVMLASKAVRHGGRVIRRGPCTTASFSLHISFWTLAKATRLLRS